MVTRTEVPAKVSTAERFTQGRHTRHTPLGPSSRLSWRLALGTGWGGLCVNNSQERLGAREKRQSSSRLFRSSMPSKAHQNRESNHYKHGRNPTVPGPQVWRGAFFLADFIFSKPNIFRGATVLDLGAGTGLTSIIMATIAKTVYCTDVGEDLLSMCKKNVTLNRHMMEPAGGDVRVKQLDWLQCDLCTDADMAFSWTEEEVADMYSNTKIIIAADVCYDDDLTDGLFRTLYRLCSSFSHTCTIFISIERRMNFTLRHMDVSCDAYNYFRHCLSQLQDLVDGRCSFRVEQLPSNFAQFLLYERIEQLELWKVTATPLPV